MLKSFIKYQSLGNDFIFFDWLNQSEKDIVRIVKNKNFSQRAMQLCNRNFGIGANGILILKQNKNMPKLLIFNSDGTPAEICLNGIRCASYHLFQKTKQCAFKIKMHTRIINVKIINKNKIINIVTQVGKARYLNKKILKIKNKSIIGHYVNISNPHFIILKKPTSSEFKTFAPLISKHKIFTHGTNVEFLWKEKKDYKALIYERGAGFTLSCSSGAAAMTFLLNRLRKINNDTEIVIKMSGEKIHSWINSNNEILLKASVKKVFEGTILNLY